jgi:hypothetical protein
MSGWRKRQIMKKQNIFENMKTLTSEDFAKMMAEVKAAGRQPPPEKIVKHLEQDASWDPIDNYCRRSKLPRTKELELFVELFVKGLILSIDTYGTTCYSGDGDQSHGCAQDIIDVVRDFSRIY